MPDAGEQSKMAEIVVEPAEALVDSPLSIRLRGFVPWEDVSLRAEMLDDLKRLWFSESVFIADADGRVDLSSTGPANRAYSGADPHGVITGMELDMTGTFAGPPVFVRALDKPLRVNLSAHAASAAAEPVNLVRHLVSPGVTVLSIAKSGLSGVLCKPLGEGSHAAVLCIGGAIGGAVWAERAAALLASHGFVALALSYFGSATLPRELVEVPLEYFLEAFRWLRDLPGVDAGRMAIMCKSKGSEAGLLLASRLEQLRAVIAYVPTSVVYQGIQVDGLISSARSSWTWEGAPLPFVPCYPEGGRFAVDTFSRLAELHTANLDNQWIVERARIPVERITGGLLLISAEADRVWPSRRHAEEIMRSLEAEHWRGYVNHVSYAAAGHGIAFPFLPQQSFGGGTASGNSAAEADSWPLVLGFLRDRLALD